MRFIAIEGIDGSGKSTQTQKLQLYFKSKKIKTKFLHFPQLTKNGGIFGDMVARFLRGEFGSIENVNPYLVALIYAGDRSDASKQIRNWIKQKYFVIVDRYVYSNIAYQCAKINNKNEKQKLNDWILNLEYNYYKIPKPDITFYLDVPLSFSFNKLTEIRKGAERNYLKGKNDIHEQNLMFQKNVRNEYLRLSKQYNDFRYIKCFDKNNLIYKPDKIFNLICNEIEKKL